MKSNEEQHGSVLPQPESAIPMIKDPEKSAHLLSSAHQKKMKHSESPPDSISDSSRDGEEGLPSKPDEEAITHGSGQFQLYPIRFCILALFVAYSMSNAFQWIEFAIIGNVVSDYYGVSRIAVEWTSMIFMVSYIPLIFPAAWFLEKYGLRKSMIVGSAGTAVGSWLKVFGTDPGGFVWVFLGQTLVAFSQVFILGVPSHLAAQWFGPNELSTATAVGVFGNQLGIALGFFVPPMLVPATNDNDAIKKGFSILFYSVAGLTSVLFILIIFVIRDKAPTATSAAQALQATNASPTGKQFFKSIFGLLFGHKGYALLFLTYGLNVGVFYAISTLLNPMLLAHYPGAEKDAGIIGSLFVISGMLGSVACGVIMDRTHKYKETTLGVYIMSLVGMCIYSASFPLGILGVVYASGIAVGFFMTGYLPVGFELAAEITYPEAEGTTSGLLNASAQIFGLAITWVASALLDQIGTLLTNSILCGILVLGAILTFFIPNDLRRRAAHAAAVYQN